MIENELPSTLRKEMGYYCKTDQLTLILFASLAAQASRTNMVSDAEHITKVLKVVANDARICHENLELLKQIEGGRAAAGVTGTHYHAHIFERLAQNAQQAAMLNLAKIFDETKDALGIRKLDKKNKGLPEELSEPELIKQHIERLKMWRNALLAHSGAQQLKKDIPSSYPLSQNDLAEILNYAFRVIEHYRLAHCPECNFGIPPQLTDVLDHRWQGMKDAVEVLLGSKVAVPNDDPRIQRKPKMGFE
ncbi:hypothetical protein [Litorivita sp. NS0012-18]|uniref:AbiU2 domain-containing protein n=1 Tax=Litorivita sp. NS0012-18 TaxID=3127655 RepID=UPI0033428D9B